MMIYTLVAAFALSGSFINAAITGDLNCTLTDAAGNIVYAPTATSCSNVMDDAECQTLFGNDANDKGAVAGGSDDRSTKCYKDAAGNVSPTAKATSMKYCPKFCGFCCETDAYTCSNNPTPAIDCSTVTQTMCNDPTLKQELVQNCPASCGFCDVTGCEDKDEDFCKANPTICRSDPTFASATCQRTCGYCTPYGTVKPSSQPATNAPSGNCVDKNTKCQEWNGNGFCSSDFWPDDVKKDNCAKTCNLC